MKGKEVIDKAKEIRELAMEERFDKALDMIAEIEQSAKLPPNLLVLKAICIQLGEDSRYQMSDAEEAYKEALGIDDEYVEALNELGYFYLGLKENPAEAMPLFEKALDVCESQMTESVLGLAQCLLQTGDKDAALRFLQGVRKSPMDMERIEELESEIRSGNAGRS